MVIDHTQECGPDALFWPFSVSKVFIATLIHSLADDRAIDLDRPVSAYWPQFGRSGKERITVRDVLQHRSGLPRVGGSLQEVAEMTHWAPALERISRARPQRSPADDPAYEWIAWGFILGEVARRVSGQELSTLLRERLLAPIGTAPAYLPLPPEEDWRAVPLRGRDPGTAVIATVLNREAMRRAVIPASGVWTAAATLADLLEALRTGLLLSPQSRRALVSPSNDGEFDRFAGSRVWWGNGVQLGHPDPRPLKASSFGRNSSPRTFGHNGSNVSMAWTDPDRALTFVHLGATISPYPFGRLHLMAVEDDLLTACDLGSR